MAGYLKLLEKGAELTGLDDELALIEALAETAKKWVELAKKIEGASSLDAFLNSLATGIDSEEVKKAFTDLELGNARGTISRLLGKLTGGSKKIPAKYKNLFEPMSKYKDGGGLVDWTLKLDEEAKVGKGIALGIKADATLAFEAASKTKLDGLPEKRRLRIGAAAGVKANANGDFPIRYGKVTAKANASVGVDLNYYFAPAYDGTLFAAAVAGRILDLPDPFSFDGVWEAFQQRTDLDALVYSFADQAGAEVNLALSASGSLPEKILADVKLAISARASVKNNFQLSLVAPAAAAGQARAITVTLGRTTASEAGVSVGLDIGVDFSAPFGKVRELLDRAVARSDEVLAKVTPFLSPGSWLRGEFKQLVEDQAKSLIANKELRDALVKDLQRLTGGQAPGDPALLTWLNGRITDAIDDAAKELTQRGEDARDEVISRIANALPESLRGPFREKATVAVGPLVDKLKEELEKQLEDLRKDANFGKALDDIGAAAGKVLKDLDDAFAAVRKLVERYNNLLHKAQAFANDAARAKVTASLKIEELWNWGLEEKIVGTFTENTTQAKEVFRQLSRGDLDEVRKLILKGPDAPVTPGFRLDRDNSSIKRSAGSTSKENLELVVFGFGLSASALLSGKASILIDGNGEVQVDSEANLERRFKSGDEEREASFVNSYSLRLAKAAQGAQVATRSIEVGVGLSYIDEKLKLEELRKHVDSLVKGGLVTSDTTAAAEAWFRAWSPGAKPIAANFAVKFRLGHDQLRKLLFLDSQPKGPLASATRDRLVDTAVAAGEKLGPNPGAVKIGKQRYEASTALPPKPMNMFMRDRVAEAWKPEREYSKAELNTTNVHELVAEYTRLVKLIEMFDKLREIYNARPRVDDTSPADAWSERDYADAEKLVARAGAKWILAGGKPAQVPAATVTFLATICDLLGLPRHAEGAPIPEGPDAVTLIFSRRKADSSIAEEVPLTQIAS